MKNKEEALEVRKNILPIRPPIMVFTARFRSLPVDTNKDLRVEFYYVVPAIEMYSDKHSPRRTDCEPILEYIASSIVGKDRKATLQRRMNPGKYTIIARVVINDCETWSNEVTFHIT